MERKTEYDRAIKEIVARIDRLPITRYMWAVFLIAAFGYFFDFFEVSTGGAIAPYVSQAFSAPIGIATLNTTFVLLGMLVGSATGGYLADRYGRKTMFLYTLIGWGTFAVIAALSVNIEMLLATRFIQGIFLGIEIPTLDTYLNEILPSRMRGKYFQLVFAIFEWYVPLIFGLGTLILPYTPINLGWRLMLIIGAVMAIALYFTRLWLPESPRWLAVRGRIDKAEEVVTDMEKYTKKYYKAELPSLLVNDITDVMSPKVPVSELFTNRKLLKLTALWIPIYFLSFFGWYFFITALPSILYAAGYTIFKTIYFTFITSIGAAVLAIIPVFTIDSIGRKWTYVASVIALIVFALLYIAIPSVPVFLLSGFIISGVVTMWADVVHQWGPETYPNRNRASATGINYSMARLGASLAPIIGVYVATLYSLSGIMILGIIVSIIAMILALFVPETKKALLEKIHE